jgi:LysR family transcriptional regulator, carnitine catabolism transcriptional activator
MERRHVEYFVAVVDHGGFTRAAQALRVAQPSLSQVIKTLEREVGVELFQRVSTGARLTSAGEELVGPARQLLRDFDSAKAAVAGVSSLVAGRLEIAAVTGLVMHVLPQLLGEFRRLHPEVAIRIMDPGIRDVAGLVRSGEAEIGLSYFAPSGADLDLYCLPDVEGVLVLPPGSPPAPTVRPLADLERIGLVASSASRIFLVQLLNEHGIAPHFVAETYERGALISMVLEGVGAVVLGDTYAEYAEALGAVVCHLDPPLRRKVVVVGRASQLSPAAKAFCSIAAVRSLSVVRAGDSRAPT